VESGVKLPGDWGSFLRVDDNKTELFKYLAEQTVWKLQENRFWQRVISLFCQNQGLTCLESPLVPTKKRIRGFC